ncbi:TetR/AcrR family transcriptional regulator [Actinocorallia longicatena]|uniref:TetR/AcrR family transcriptional regulator n=1 Tax=Actinocorallia longicatena TaxID=111803 RepID=A0ABP6Q3B3_9ACTN
MTRSQVVADAAITLLDERGLRGLTHRAVDEAAGLPPGATSNVARSRAALLELTLSRLTERETEVFAAALEDAGGLGAGATDDLARVLARLLALQLADETRTAARYELALEARRRPELREIYDRAGRGFRDPAVALLAAAGSQDPRRHARQLVAFSEGLMFDAIAGAGGALSEDGLRLALTDLLSGMLDHRR